MDAANPLCRWLLAAGLAAASGGTPVRHACDDIPTIRGQVPEPAAPDSRRRSGPACPSFPIQPRLTRFASPGRRCR